MKEVVRIILLTVNIITFALVLIYGASGIIQTLFGAGVYEKMLVKIGIPWDHRPYFNFIGVIGVRKFTIDRIGILWYNAIVVSGYMTCLSTFIGACR